MPKLSHILAGAFAVTVAAGAAMVQARPPAPPFAPGFLLESSRAIPRRGARVRVWTLRRDRGNRSAIELVMVIAPRRAATLEVKPIATEGMARDVYPRQVCDGALAAVNGSFFYHDARGFRPMGLVRVEGRTVQGPSPRKSGGFLTSDGRRLTIVHKATPSSALAARFAVESSPILIYRGQSGMRSDDMQRFDRVAVGATEGGDLVLLGAFGVAQRSVSLWEFEKLARAGAAAEGVAIRDLIAMDGGPSAHLYLPDDGAGVLFGQGGHIYTPNLVCIGLRAPGR
jgi:hypothetical protein